uniref:Uncharacterized protein n=1 Tax=Siphoviridae sp. ctjel6 TaxID=2826440 RepID=A0A8S5N7E9_9CAUD|nr:MAG TPA: hypothetical protein [Siphoviridae sp. ctjel6]
MSDEPASAAAALADVEAEKLMETLTIGEHVLLTATLGTTLDKLETVDPIAMFRALGLISAQRLATAGAPAFTPDVVDGLSLVQLADLIRAGARTAPQTPQALAPLVARINQVLGDDAAEVGEAARPFRAADGGDDGRRTARHAQPVLDADRDRGAGTPEGLAQSQHGPVSVGW